MGRSTIVVMLRFPSSIPESLVLLVAINTVRYRLNNAAKTIQSSMHPVILESWTVHGEGQFIRIQFRILDRARWWPV